MQEKIDKELAEKIKRLLVVEPSIFERNQLDFLHLLQRVMSINPEKNPKYWESFDNLIKRLEKNHPKTAYMYHMEFSGHSEAFLRLCEETGVQFRAPMLDLGSGVGNLIWWLWRKRKLPAGKISLLDNDPGMTDYAETLVRLHCSFPKGKYDFGVHTLDGALIAKRLSELGGPFKTILSVLVLQWLTDRKALDPKKAIEKIEKTIKAVFESLEPDGEFILVGEDDPDAVSISPVKFLLDLPPGQKLDIIEEICGRAGFLSVEQRATPVCYASVPRVDDHNMVMSIWCKKNPQIHISRLKQGPRPLSGNELLRDVYGDCGRKYTNEDWERATAQGAVAYDDSIPLNLLFMHAWHLGHMIDIAEKDIVKLFPAAQAGELGLKSARIAKRLHEPKSESVEMEQRLDHAGAGERANIHLALAILIARHEYFQPHEHLRRTVTYKVIRQHWPEKYKKMKQESKKWAKAWKESARKLMDTAYDISPYETLVFSQFKYPDPKGYFTYPSITCYSKRRGKKNFLLEILEHVSQIYNPFYSVRVVKSVRIK